MKDRIILLIKAKNLTAAQFAEIIGVQKSSISHIISGRNNASLDFIQKILVSFPDVNMEWLMLGKGPLFKVSEGVFNNLNDTPLHAQIMPSMPSVDLFSELNPVNTINFKAQNEQTDDSLPIHQSTKQEGMQKEDLFATKENKVAITENLVTDSVTQEVLTRSKSESTKSIIKIVEFYSDNTYKEYFPE